MSLPLPYQLFRGRDLTGDCEGRSVPNEASAIIASRLFATKPHLAGAPQDLQTAKDFLAVLQRELGIAPPTPEPLFSAGSEASRHATESITKLKKPAAWIDTYYPVMNTPLERELVVVAKNGTVVWEADLVEEADATDPEAHLYADAVPTFHGLSPEGTAVGQLVYANYGTQEVNTQRHVYIQNELTRN